MTPRLIRHVDLLPPMPATWRCLICGGPQRTEEAASCERCGGWLHWTCYWPAALSAAELAAFAIAQEADERAEQELVEVQAAGRLFQFPAIVGASAVDAFLSRQIILCPGCRS